VGGLTIRSGTAPDPTRATSTAASSGSFEITVASPSLWPPDGTKLTSTTTDWPGGMV
jgi:hypothetical protein